MSLRNNVSPSYDNAISRSPGLGHRWLCGFGRGCRNGEERNFSPERSTHAIVCFLMTFLNFWRTSLYLSVICGRSGAPFEGDQKTANISLPVEIMQKDFLFIPSTAQDLLGKPTFDSLIRRIPSPIGKYPIISIPPSDAFYPHTRQGGTNITGKTAGGHEGVVPACSASSTTRIHRAIPPFPTSCTCRTQ